MKNIVLITTVAVFVVYVLADISPNVTYPYKQECGLYVVPKKNITAPNPRKPQENADIVCGFCMDLVGIAEMYAECYEADVQDIMIQWCVDQFKGNKNEAICRYIVNDLMQDLEKWSTSFDPAQSCNTLLHLPNNTCVDS